MSSSLETDSDSRKQARRPGGPGRSGLFHGCARRCGKRDARPFCPIFVMKEKRAARLTAGLSVH
jgi:hypothetical protein